MGEPRKNSREAKIIILPELVDKVAEMFKGTTFNDAILQCAAFGIEQLYEAHLQEKIVDQYASKVLGEEK